MTARLTASLVALLLVVAGCGGPDPQALLAGASDALEEAGTSSFRMEVVVAGVEGADFAAEGAQDLGSGALRMAIDLGDEASATETLLVGSVVYVRSPLFELFTGNPATWVQVDLEEAAAAEGIDASALAPGNTGPAALLGQLEGAAGEPEELGSEEVRGVATTHLRVTIDTAAAIEQAPAEQRQQLRQYAEETGLPATYPMELWIDEQGLVRRIRTILDVPRGGTTPPTDDGTANSGGEGAGEGDAGEADALAPDAGASADGMTQQTTLELFDFGVSVDLREPSPDEVVPLADLIAQLEALEATGPGDAGEDG